MYYTNTVKDVLHTIHVMFEVFILIFHGNVDIGSVLTTIQHIDPALQYRLVCSDCQRNKVTQTVTALMQSR